MSKLLQYGRGQNWIQLRRLVRFCLLTSFLALLVATYFFRSNYSPWYDEAALIDNVANADIKQLKTGLDWLQTIPVGYFYFAKLIIDYSWGIEILRSISMASFVIGVLLAARHLLSLGTTKWFFTFVALFNPISLTYATMVKPYALEFFFGISAVILFKKEKRNLLLLLSVVCPLFSNSISILILAVSLVWLVHRRKFLYPLCLAFGTICSNLFTLLFTSPGTQELMKEAWFGDLVSPGPSSFRSAVGNLGWLPVSGLGLIPEISGEMKYLIPSVLVLCIILSLIVGQDRELVLLVIAVLLCFLLAQALLVVPAAGRLMLSTSGLIWLLVASRLEQLKTTNRFLSYSMLGMLVAFSSISSGAAFNPSGISNIEQVSTGIAKGWENVRIYTDVGAGPAAHFYLRKYDKNFTREIIWIDSDGEMSSCAPMTLQPKDRIILDGISELQAQGLLLDGSLSVLTNVARSFVLQVEQPIFLSSRASNSKLFFCRYVWSNPSRPIEGIRN